MITFKREYEKSLEIIAKNPQTQMQWIHVCGEHGSGKKEFIENFYSKHLQNANLIFQYDFNTFPFHNWQYFQRLIRHLTQQHADEFQRFLAQLPARFATSIQHALTAEICPGEANAFQRSTDAWEFYIFTEFVKFLSRKNPGVIVLHGIFEKDNEFRRHLLDSLMRIKNAPIRVFSSGSRANADFESPPFFENLWIKKRSVREVEKLIAAQFKTDMVSARLITNHLYIKSNGNLRNIRFMLEAFYRPLLDAIGRNKILDNKALQQKRVSGSLKDIFRHLAGQLSEDALDIFAFLSRLEDPFPAKILKKILKQNAVSNRDYQRWLNNCLLTEARYLNQRYVMIDWPDWKNYLRSNTSIERIRKILASLGKRNRRSAAQLPLALSTLFFDAGEPVAAIKAAHREAQHFTRLGENRRALDRHAFLRRNISRFPEARIYPSDILFEIGELQKKAGLFENAFESFRELREHFKRRQRQKWLFVSLRMADVLFQMDSHSEAHYIIKDLAIKKNVSAYIQAFSNLLNGELEQNFGHADYAIRYYEKALQLLPGVKDESLIIRLYEILKDVYLRLDDRDKYLALTEKTISLLPKNSRRQAHLQFEVIRRQISRHQYALALPRAVALYRSPAASLSPRLIMQLKLYLAEIYGYYGKWYLSRSHLTALLKYPVFTRRLRTRAEVMTYLGVVEKELGHYGDALKWLQNALEICRSANMTRLKYRAKIHLGHVYLLVYSFIQARENLIDALNWAEENREDEIAVAALLFLASYGLQQQRFDSAERYLERAEALLKLLDSPLDQLNFLYYKSIFYLKTGKLKAAEQTVQQWTQLSRGMRKFDNLSLWMNGIILMEKNRPEEAKKKLQEALRRNAQYRLPFLQFQILRDLADVFKRQNDEAGFQKYNQEAHQAFQQLLNNIGDEILRRQMEESRVYEALTKLSG